MEPPPPPPEDSGLQQNTAPAVAAPPGKTLVVLGVVIVFVVFLLSQLFGGSDAPTVDASKPQPKTVASTNVATGGPTDLPPIVDVPTAVPPAPMPIQIDIEPPALPPSTPIPLVGRETNEIDNERLLMRQRSNMLIVDEGGGLFSGNDEQDQMTPTGDPNQDFALRVSRTEADTVETGHVGNLRSTIAQGRLIHAVLESGINNDLPGPIRAIVSRDIFAEAGREKLIPRGSRLIGVYNSDVQDGQARILIVWTRMIRPDGVDVMLNSPAVDQLGMAGVPGSVDNKFAQLFARALLTSSINIAIAIGAQELINDDSGSSTTSNANGSTTQSGQAGTLATVEALDRLGGVTEDYLDRFLNVRPTITLDQGTKMNVFVNRDLIFPANLSGAGFVE